MLTSNKPLPAKKRPFVLAPLLMTCRWHLEPLGYVLPREEAISALGNIAQPRNLASEDTSTTPTCLW